LQAADLIAYEFMRELDNHLWTGKETRIPLKEILRMNENVSGFYIGKQAILDFANRVEADHDNSQTAAV